MAYRRSNAFNADVNQDLLKLIEGFQYDPYTVQATSGYRPGDKRQHGRGNALDIELIDPKSGQRLGNYQDPRTFGAYQQYANALYQHALQTNPELAQKLRWGGYFSGGPGYGARSDALRHRRRSGRHPDGQWFVGGSGLTPERAGFGTWAAAGRDQGAQQGPPAPPAGPQKAAVWKMWRWPSSRVNARASIRASSWRRRHWKPAMASRCPMRTTLASRAREKYGSAKERWSSSAARYGQLG